MRNARIALFGCLVLLCGCRATAPKPGIGVAFGSIDDPDLKRIRAALVADAASRVDLSIVEAENEQALQISQIDSLIAKPVKALAVDLVLDEAAGIIIDKAKTSIVPLVFFGREAGPDDMKKWDRVYYVGVRKEQAGSVEGRILADWWKSNPAAPRSRDAVVRYVFLGGEGQEAGELSQAFESSLSDLGLRASKLGAAGGASRAAGAAAMNRMLATDGRHLEAVVCGSDDVALGAIDALRAKGYFSGKRFMPVIGIGGTRAALDSISAGALLGTVWNDAEGQAKAVVDITRALAVGAEPSSTGWPVSDGKYVWIPYRMVTAKNVADFAK